MLANIGLVLLLIPFEDHHSVYGNAVGAFLELAYRFAGELMDVERVLGWGNWAATMFTLEHGRAL